jgi:hypothetical protein
MPTVALRNGDRAEKRGNDKSPARDWANGAPRLWRLR